MPTRLLLDGPNIESLLERVQEEHGAAARIVHAERVRSRGVGGFFAKERYEVSVEVDDATTGHDDSSRDDTYTPSTYADNAHADGAAADDPATGNSASMPAALFVAEQLDGIESPPQMSTGGSAFADVLGSITSSLGTSEAPGRADASSFVPAARPEVLPASRAYVTPTTGNSRASQAPAVRTPTLVSTPRRSTPSQQPPRPPRAAGAVLALVGEGRLAYDAAAALARTMRIDPADVLVASPEPLIAKLPASKRLTNGPATRTRAGQLLAAAQPSIVVIDYPIGADPEWSADIVDALGATAIWAMVDATRKVADLHRWTRGIRRIDALIVHNAAASDDAGSVQALGLPVALLDGRLATEAAWRAMDSDRMVW